MVDHLTRYVEAAPITAATGTNALKALKTHIFFRHSIPEVIMEDQGRQFLAKTYQKALREFGIRFNETLKRTIAKYASPDQKDWDD